MDSEDELKKEENKVFIDSFIIIVSLGILAISIFLQFNDFSWSTHEGLKQLNKPIGIVIQKINDVRQKNTTSFAWIKPKVQDPIYEGDSIFTGTGSVVKLQTENGGEITLEEQSLMLLKSSKNELELELTYGGFSGKITEGKKIVISENGSKQILESKNAEIKITKGPKKKTQIKVISGQVEISKKTLNTKEKQVSTQQIFLKSNEIVEMAQTGEVVEIKQPVNLKFPKEDQLFWFDSKNQQNFEWNTDAKNVYFRFELSKDSSFKQKVNEKIISESNTNTQNYALHNLNPGTYYWRVTSFQKTNKKQITESDTQKFFVYSKKLPQITTPLAQELIFQNDNPQQQLDIKWNFDSVAESFMVELSPTSDFKEIPVSLKLGMEHAAQMPLPKAGHYFLRVKALHSQLDQALVSATTELTVIDKKQVLVHSTFSQPLEYVYKIEDLEKIVSANNNLRSKLIKNIASESPQIEWPLELGKPHYLIQLSQDPKMQSKVLKFDQLDNHFLPILNTKKLLFGKWFLDVYAFYPNHSFKQKIYSDVLDYKIPSMSPPQMELKQIAVVSLTTGNFKKPYVTHISWKAIENADEYEVLISQDTKFSKFEAFKSKETSLDFNSQQEKNLFVKVQALMSASQLKSEWSLVQNLEFPKPQIFNDERNISSTVIISDQMPIPNLKSPPNLAEMHQIGQSIGFVRLKWMTPKRVPQFEFEISKTDQFDKTELKKKINHNSFVLKQNELQSGSYFWRVRSVQKDYYSKWSQPSNFILP